MDSTCLWKHVILRSKQMLGSRYGVSIPYLVGVYYAKGKICNVETPACIKEVLQDIIDAVQPGDEVTIFPCDSYSPHIDIVQMLTGNRNEHEINMIRSKNPCLYNCNGLPVVYLPVGTSHTIDTLTLYFWNKYQAPITNKKFSVFLAERQQSDGSFNCWSEIKEQW